jgi:hypothetical protein
VAAATFGGSRRRPPATTPDITGGSEDNNMFIPQKYIPQKTAQLMTYNIPVPSRSHFGSN